MILPSDSTEQEALYKKLMRISNLKQARTIKGAAVNLILTVILQTSSNADEAILQWNEISLAVDTIIKDRWKAPGALADDFDPTSIKFNGG